MAGWCHIIPNIWENKKMATKPPTSMGTPQFMECLKWMSGEICYGSFPRPDAPRLPRPSKGRRCSCPAESAAWRSPRGSLGGWTTSNCYQLGFLSRISTSLREHLGGVSSWGDGIVNPQNGGFLKWGPPQIIHFRFGCSIANHFGYKGAPQFCFLGCPVL